MSPEAVPDPTVLAKPPTEFDIQVLQKRVELLRSEADALEDTLIEAMAHRRQFLQTEFGIHLNLEHGHQVYIGNTREIHAESHPDCKWKPEVER